MATYIGTANSVPDLLRGVIYFLTDSTNFGAGNEWKLVEPATVDDISTECILKGIGDGQDDIYLGFQLASRGVDQIDIVLNGYAGYDAGLTWREQPGGISHATLPTIPLVRDTFMTYWVSATTKRIIIVVELSTQYESAYIGLMNPVAIERQYPYPLVIGGSAYEGIAWTSTTWEHSYFANPGGSASATSLRIRRPDGDWRVGLNYNGNNLAPLSPLCVWPTNVAPVRAVTIYDPVLTLENVIMYPFLLYESLPVGTIGQLDGIYWVGNREDLATKDSISYGGKIYKIFNNVQRRDNDQYFAVEWV
ncbi:hypothetical protein HSX37_16135|uniref:Uncharacterized protein n=1 Tax=Dendrosporobacter quercicolus TaxID=146817 RepID=A0A1G9ZPC1_9FIRM|nr:hypothetical protein [Dendrosporobacter quercicolus]NSL49565.1 hypothetical protein [Dendrosporobacter quercicolus DSM 1736]SDN22927.1 hypothetical protein SAMN04488502_11520 [Dendrosporobacter quercicolus]